ncbi:MAG: hypothetical protein K2H03_08550 [Muribaculaceae bacterium]|nr:hypothetical protein [Muribaculaceae bacterium]MDE5930513.1 hypothetical protein [Muribaculaceae bacterium]
MTRLRACLPLVVALALASCHHLDDDRIPPAPVLVQFNTVADWDAYGVPGAMSWRYFIKSERQPQNYPYTAMSATGFGGILLCGDINGNPLAYDLSCPVECRADVRVYIDQEALVAECPKCHSTYDVFSLWGHPLSGEAAERGYGLRRYTVRQGGQNEYRVISY